MSGADLEISARFRQACARLIPPHARVLVAYSGGADSACLLHMLHDAGFALVAAHLNHGQRTEAEREVADCAAFAERLGISFVSGRADVPRMAREMKVGIEEAGREARYEFLQRAAIETGCALIATGHTLTDHAETVLLHLVRGTGLAGLAGIPEQRDNIIRPLRGIAREETRAYCEAHRLPFLDDPANVDDRFSRTLIRMRVMPELRRLNPQAEGAIARLAEIAGEEDRFLDGMAAAALERAEVALNGELSFLTSDVEVAFSLAGLGSLPAVLFRRAIRLAVGALGATLDAHQTDIVESAVRTQAPSGSVTAEGGQVVVEWAAGEHVHIRRMLDEGPFRHPLRVPGETIDDQNGWRLALYADVPPTDPPRRASLDVYAANLVSPLYFRSALPGDRLQPLGFAGHRKLSDLFGEAGLTAAARLRLPIVCDTVGPFWAPGVCLDERVRPQVGAERAVRLEFRKL